VRNPELQRLFQEYADAHRHPMTRLTHKISIPLIVFFIIAMSDWWRVIVLESGVAVTGAHFGIALASLWYLKMDVKLGLIMIASMLICLPLGWVTPVWLVFVIAVFSIALQLLGHAIWEKSSPAFVKNLVQTLVGPLFFIALLTRDWPQKSAIPA
jgi:uncharacterized membrane protein YGL010W